MGIFCSLGIMARGLVYLTVILIFAARVASYFPTFILPTIEVDTSEATQTFTVQNVAMSLVGFLITLCLAWVNFKILKHRSKRFRVLFLTALMLLSCLNPWTSHTAKVLQFEWALIVGISCMFPVTIVLVIIGLASIPFRLFVFLCIRPVVWLLSKVF